MRRLAILAVTSLAAAATGFVLHVSSVEVLARWVAAQMAGGIVAPSWDVRIPAALSSLETGVGLVLLYALVRPALPVRHPAIRGALMGVLLLMAMGRLGRQPLMDFLVGNPSLVVLVQNGSVWLTWILMGVVTAVLYEALMARGRARANGPD